MSHSLKTLTRGFAATCKPETMTLTDIDRLYASICCVLVEQPQHVDLLALDQLATELDNHRRKRRLGVTGHIDGQLDMYGNELAA